jgi:hypothetical protein
MEKEDILSHANRLLDKQKTLKDASDSAIVGIHAETCELIRVAMGPNSAFLETLNLCNPNKTYDQMRKYARAINGVTSVLRSFIDHIEAGLLTGISPQRQAQLDVVSDYLEMAMRLLEDKNVHPAAPAVLIGATLEEFLRTWVEAENLSLGNRKAGMEAYSQILREANLITRQDGKDITSWAGIRNHAAHGEWDEVADKRRISLMLEGVNLFMRKYSPAR